MRGADARFLTSGAIALAVAMGVGRFAYTPLIPPLVTQHWFSPSQAAYLGAANLAGYLAGALGSAVAARRIGMEARL